jgi:hypothetical protein
MRRWKRFSVLFGLAISGRSYCGRSLDGPAAETPIKYGVSTVPDATRTHAPKVSQVARGCS